jgi:hypothetical protein
MFLLDLQKVTCKVETLGKACFKTHAGNQKEANEKARLVASPFPFSSLERN